MKFIIASDDKNKRIYLAVGPQRWVEDINTAFLFKSEDAAKNYVNGGTRFFDDRKNKLIYVCIDGETKEVLKDVPPPIKDEESASALFDSVSETARSLVNFKTNIANLYDYYTSLQVECDYATQDILHRIELYPINGITSFRLVKQLKDIRKKRRACKDRIELLSGLKGNLDAETIGNILLGWENNKKEREYKPRVLKELFEEVERHGDNKAQ